MAPVNIDTNARKGMPHDEPKDDPQLGNKRNDLIVQAARQLTAAKMIRFDEISNSFMISDLGRIAAKYYLKYQTMEIFSRLSNYLLKSRLDILIPRRYDVPC
jgi:antiviral helicase SLH1